jgi:hypothetical protein
VIGPVLSTAFATALATALVTISGAARAAEPPVSVLGRAVPDTATIGSPVRYEVEVRARAGVEVFLSQPSERLGVFEIVDFGDAPPRDDGDVMVTSRWFSLVGYEVGHHLVESPRVSYRVAGEPLAAAPPAETRISLRSLVDADEGGGADVRDIAPPEPIPLDWRRPLLLAGAVLALLALGLSGWWIMRRRTRGVAAPPLPPASETARQALQALEARALMQSGEIKEYYAELSGIVRRYLEARFGVRAPEMTTEEFLLATARGGTLSSRHRALLTDFLRESDLVKFARHRPSLADAQRALEAARHFVDETADVEPVAA